MCTNFLGMQFSRTIKKSSSFVFEDHLLPSLLQLHMHCDCLKIEDLIFKDDKLLAKATKIMSLKNLYALQ